MYEDTGFVMVAGGSARRFGGGNKLLLEAGGLPVFLHGVREFAGAMPGRFVIVTPADQGELFRSLAEKYCPEARILWTTGGAARSDSVRAGLAMLPDGVNFVAIHDAARPLATRELLAKVLERAREIGGAVPGKPVTDTLKRTDGEGVISETVDRSDLWRVETPQVFDAAKLKQAYEAAAGREFTDDAGVMAAAGFDTAVVFNPAENLKITYAGDAAILVRLLEEQGR